jgi:hypothetical protein
MDMVQRVHTVTGEMGSGVYRGCLHRKTFDKHEQEVKE